MNHIAKLQTEIDGLNALADGYAEGIATLKAYLFSPKFAEDRSVNVDDILLRLREITNNAHDMEAQALSNATGPAPVPSRQGWICPTCQASLVSETPWNDTDSKARERMRLHWRETHREG